LEAKISQGILRLNPLFELDIIPCAYWREPWLPQFILATDRADFSVQSQDGFLAFHSENDSENDSRGAILGIESRRPTQAASGFAQL
jgi:hypothetical protein